MAYEIMIHRSERAFEYPKQGSGYTKQDLECPGRDFVHPKYRSEYTR